MPRLMRLRKWYRQYLEEAERGRTFVASLLECVADLRGRVAQTDAAILEELGNEISKLMETAEIQELRGLVPQPGVVVCPDDPGPDARHSVSSLLVCRISPPNMPTPIGTCSQYRLL
jgi:hypothetical protein